MMFRPTHLSLFVFGLTAGRPGTMLPFYAEVVAPVEQPVPPVPVDQRFSDSVDHALRDLEGACFADASCRQRLREAVQDALVRVLTPDARDVLAAEPDGGGAAIEDIVKRTQQATGQGL